MVLMEGNKKIEIEKVQIGDKVLTYNMMERKLQIHHHQLLMILITIKIMIIFENGGYHHLLMILY